MGPLSFLRFRYICSGGRNYILYELDLYDRMDTINELLARYGVKFGIYKNN